MLGKSSAIILGIAIVVAAGVFGATYAFFTESTTEVGTNAVALPFFGHVTIVAEDSEGNAKAYFQSDNLVVGNGTNCAGLRLFGADSSPSCTSNTVFEFVAIGNGTSNTDPLIGELTSEFNRTSATVSNLGFDESFLDTEVDLTAVFELSNGTATIDDGTTITETGLFNDASAGQMFSNLEISPAIIVSAGDVVTITWEVFLFSGT